MNKALEEELNRRWPIHENLSEPDECYFIIFRETFADGATWQSKSTSIQPLYTEKDILKFTEWITYEGFKRQDDGDWSDEGKFSKPLGSKTSEELLALWKASQIPQLPKIQ